MKFSGELKFYPAPWSEVLASQLFQWEELSFPRPWTLSEWMSFKDPNYFVLIQEGKTPAFALFHFPPMETTAHLLKIWLHPQGRGQGMAQHFWKDLVEDLKARGVKDIYLEVEEKNLSAKKFYQRVGGEKLHSKAGYYSDGAAAEFWLVALGRS